MAHRRIEDMHGNVTFAWILPCYYLVTSAATLLLRLPPCYCLLLPGYDLVTSTVVFSVSSLLQLFQGVPLALEEYERQEEVRYKDGHQADDHGTGGGFTNTLGTASGGEAPCTTHLQQQHTTWAYVCPPLIP